MTNSTQETEINSDPDVALVRITWEFDARLDELLAG